MENADPTTFADFADETDENWPYCECDLEPTEDEEASNCCSACGKAIQ